MEKIFQYSSEIQAIPLIRKDLEELAREWSLPGSELRQIILIVEELFSNTIRFAYQDESDHRLEIRFSKNDSLVSIEMIDDGIPFDPLNYNHALHSDPAAQDDGGMGLTLVKAFADSVEYRREEPRNHLVIKKIIRSTTDTDNP